MLETRHNFTLIEVVVALVIIMMATGLAVSAFRGESPSMKMERASTEFAAFCATTRFWAAEDGVEWVISYDPLDKCFTARRAPGQADAGTGDDDTGDDGEAWEWNELPAEQKYTLPEGFVFSTPSMVEEELFDGETLEIFRFFADGGASGGYRLIFRCGELERVFEISRLTGRLLTVDTEQEADTEIVI